MLVPPLPSSIFKAISSTSSERYEAVDSSQYKKWYEANESKSIRKAIIGHLVLCLGIKEAKTKVALH